MADISGSKGNGEGVTFTYIIRCTETSYNADTNKHTVQFKLIAKQSWSGLMYSQWGTGVTLVVNGTTLVDNYVQRKLDGSGEHVYYTYSKEFDGNEDGTFSLSVSGKWYQNSPTYFVSGGVSASGTFTGTTLDVGGFMYVNVNGTWKKGTPYVNVNGTWKQGKAYINNNGTWKKTKA